MKDIFYVLLSMFIGMLLVSTLLVGCTNNQIEISQKIKPIISIADDDNEVGLEYELGPFLILDVIEVNKAQLKYLKTNSQTILDLVVEYDDCECGNIGFIYYLRGNQLNKKHTKPMKLKKLLDHADKIPGLVWIIKDGEEIKSINRSENPHNPEAPSMMKKLE